MKPDIRSQGRKQIYLRLAGIYSKTQAGALGPEVGDEGTKRLMTVGYTRRSPASAHPEPGKRVDLSR